MTGIPVAYAREPFARSVFRDVMPAGLSLEEVARRVPDLPDRFWERGVICVSGEPVAREWWPRVRPRQDGPLPVSVTLHVPLRGGGEGGGGSKSTFSLVASIALIAATTAISGGALGPGGLAIAGGFFAAGSTSATVLAAGVGILGGLAVSALSPPPRLPRGDQPEGGQALGSASASGNIVDPGGVIPRVIGTHRVYPPLACQPLVDLVSGEEIVEAVFCLNGPHKWEDVRVDDVPISTIPNTSSQQREGFSSDSALTLVTRQAHTDGQPIELDAHDFAQDGTLEDQSTPGNSLPEWNTKATRLGPEEVKEHLLFASLNSSLDPTAYRGFVIRIRMRPVGETTWVNLPEIHYWGRSSTPFRKAIELLWDTSPGVAAPASTGFCVAFLEVPTQTATPTGIGGWTADSYFDDTVGDSYMYSGNTGSTRVRRVVMGKHFVRFYLGHNASTFPTDVKWELQIRRGFTYARDDFDITAYEISGLAGGTFVHDFFGYYNVAGTYYAGGSPNTSNDATTLIRNISVWNELPLAAGSKIAALAITAKNRALQRVSALASGYVPDWDGADWTGGATTTSSNPVPHYRNMLVGTLNVDPLPEALVDNDVLVDWRARCIAQGYECNMIADGQTLEDLLRVVAGCGYARPRQSDLWAVMQDYDRSAESPVQVFSPRNMADFSWRKAFPRRPHGLRLRYRDSSNDYEEADELIVYDEGYSAANATRLEAASYDGLVTEAAVSARAAFDLAQARLRDVFYSGRCDAEALVAVRGDLVGVQHDIIHHQAGFGYVLEKETSGGNVTGLVLDTLVPQVGSDGDVFALEDVFAPSDVFSLGGQTGVCVRLKDGTFIVKEALVLETGEFATITFLQPFADPGDDLEEGCFVTTGLLGYEYKRLILADVQPGEDLTAELTFVDEAPTLFA